MPTYEYRCKNCGEHLEVVQSFKDDPLKVCPQCDGELRKVFSPIGISFKGSGFYKTDSRSSSSAAAAKSGEAKSPSSAPSSTSDSKSSDSKSSDSKSSESKTSSDSKSSESKTASAS